MEMDENWRCHCRSMISKICICVHTSLYAYVYAGAYVCLDVYLDMSIYRDIFLVLCSKRVKEQSSQEQCSHIAPGSRSPIPFLMKESGLLGEMVDSRYEVQNEIH